ncbi:MAG: glycosyltransferase family 4 protein [Gammaproteobacteria bacterium]|jgi:glycosyltransferase involved in cell wall biosynthesis|nr:glycosyltransferase family 4 protein [Gammaproteobacteria bacterium]MBT3870104.1 glycosyltransferase family 4 protein [Gammaproteobacteria bacterium]MBT5199434.1 glycosyltransferase family 4 protein [Gammaproteobacteria bacterium]MBT7529520.1 glycosyltransferase family 4 protein [Gammaproteobacteria bacterium]
MNTGQHWLCAQLGAREHYAIPRALQRHHRLDGFYTDYWGKGGTRLLASKFNSKATRSLAAKHHPDIPEQKIRSRNLRSLLWTSQLKLAAGFPSTNNMYRGYCEVGRKFACSVARQLDSHYPQNTVYFGYDTTSLEIMEKLRKENVLCVVGQVDPCRTEIELVREEAKTWPGWQANALEVPQVFFDRHEAEWELADKVIVNSEFSRQALISQGVISNKIAVIPLAYEPQVQPEIQENEKTPVFTNVRPLKVLYLGQVNLRKGIQYLMKAAATLPQGLVTIDVVGPIHISEAAVKTAPDNLVFHGPVTVDKIRDWYLQADVFVLPTLSDGFAITQLEAMAHGVPVITTPNCGDVVEDSADGYIVKPRDAEALATAITKYLQEPQSLAGHRAAAIRKSTQFSLDRLFERLVDATTACRPDPPAS